MMRFDARVELIKALKEKGLFRGECDNKMRVPKCSRTVRQPPRTRLARLARLAPASHPPPPPRPPRTRHHRHARHCAPARSPPRRRRRRCSKEPHMHRTCTPHTHCLC